MGWQPIFLESRLLCAQSSGTDSRLSPYSIYLNTHEFFWAAVPPYGVPLLLDIDGLAGWTAARKGDADVGCCGVWDA